MTGPAGMDYNLTWSRRNLAVLIVLCLVCAGSLASRGLRQHTEFGERIAVHPARVQAAAERIDPNTATAASLRRLPGIGQEIVQRIIAYRQQQAGQAFRTPDDLTKVKGIGPKKLQRIRPFLQMASAN